MELQLGAHSCATLASEATVLTLQFFPVVAENTSTKMVTIETFPILKRTFLSVKWLLLNSKSIGFALLWFIKFSSPFPEICSDLTKYMVFWVTACINKHKG